MFHASLTNYAMNLFHRDGIRIKTQHHITELRPGLPGSTNPEVDGGCFTLTTKQDGEMGVGMCVWSTGLMMNPFIQNALDDVHTYPTKSATLSAELSEPSEKKWMLKRHPKSGGLMVDARFRVKLLQRDDLATNSFKRGPEATMQDVFAIGDVAVLEKNQLPATAQVANQEAKWLGKRLNKGDLDEKAFDFNNMGVMTYLGNMKAIMQTDSGTGIKG